MKKIVVVSLFLLCAMLSSCEKAESPEKTLIGTWDMTLSLTYYLLDSFCVSKSIGSDGNTYDLIYYTFDSSGNGIIYYSDTDIQQNFTYVYDNSKGAIQIVYEKGAYLGAIKTQSVSWIIDELTKDTLICHGEIDNNSNSELSKIIDKYYFTVDGKKKD